MQVEDTDSISEIVNPDKNIDVFHSGMNIISVYSDQMDQKGNDQNPIAGDGSSQSAHSLEKPPATEEPPVSRENSKHSVTDHLIVGRDNDRNECPDEVEISELWLDFELVKTIQRCV